MSKRSGWIVLLALSVALAACAREDAREDDVTPPEPETNTIVDVLIDEGFTTLVSAVEAAGLSDTLGGEGVFTVFAPTDAAFEALPDGVLDDLLADPAARAFGISPSRHHGGRGGAQ